MRYHSREDFEAAEVKLRLYVSQALDPSIHTLPGFDAAAAALAFGMANGAHVMDHREGVEGLLVIAKAFERGDYACIAEEWPAVDAALEALRARI